MSALLPETVLSDGLLQVEIPQQGLVLGPVEAAMACGYPVDRVPDYFPEMADCAEHEIRKRLAIHAGYLLAPLEITDPVHHKFQIGQIEFAADERLIRYLGACQQAAVFLCSLGSLVDDFISEQQRCGELALAFVANTIAALLAEHATQALHAQIEQSVVPLGLGVTNRYSPGYCNWDVGQQQSLFQLFPSGFCGVHLTESSLMLPIKSVSGIIGVGRGARIIPYDCGHCSQSDCNYRTINQRRANACVLPKNPAPSLLTTKPL